MENTNTQLNSPVSSTLKGLGLTAVGQIVKNENMYISRINNIQKIIEGIENKLSFISTNNPRIEDVIPSQSELDYKLYSIEERLSGLLNSIVV